MISDQRPPVNNGHYFWVPRVVVVYRFDSMLEKVTIRSRYTFLVLQKYFFPLKKQSQKKAIIFCLNLDQIFAVLSKCKAKNIQHYNKTFLTNCPTNYKDLFHDLHTRQNWKTKFSLQNHERNFKSADFKEQSCVTHIRQMHFALTHVKQQQLQQQQQQPHPFLTKVIPTCLRFKMMEKNLF